MAALARIVLVVTALTVVAVVTVQIWRSPRLPGWVAYAAAAIPVVIIAAFLAGLGLKRTYAGEIAAVTRMCAAFPREGSVVFLPAGSAMSSQRWCAGCAACPTATAKSARPPAVGAIVEDIQRAGRRPVLLAGFGRALVPYGPPRRIMALHTAGDGETLTVPPMQTAPFRP